MKRFGLWAAVAAALVLSLALAGCKPAEPAVMSLMAFAGYAEDAWVKPFEEANKCTVKINYSGQVDEMYNKVKSAPNEYNIVSIDPGRILLVQGRRPAAAGGREEALQLPQDGRLLPRAPLQQAAGRRGHLPRPHRVGHPDHHGEHGQGPQGQAGQVREDWDKRTISYDIFTAPEFKGQTAFFDESTNVTSCAAMALGIENPFKFTEEDFKSVADLLYKWKKNARTFTTGPGLRVQRAHLRGRLLRAGRQRRPAEHQAGGGRGAEELHPVRARPGHHLLDRRLGHHRAHQGQEPGAGLQVHRHDDRRRRCRSSWPT